MGRSTTVDRLVQMLLQERYGDVLSATRSLVVAAPLQSDLQQIRALALTRTGDAGSALESYRRALVATPAHHLACYNFANNLRNLGRLPEAAGNYRRASLMVPGFPEASNNLGLVRQEQGDLAGSEQSFRRAIRLDRRRASYRVNLAKLLAAQGRHEAAAACCRRALLLQPDAADAWATLALAGDVQERYGEALSGYRRALAADPVLAPTRSNAALLDLRLGRFAEGWAGYHYRRKPVVEVRNPDGAPLPEWSGAPLAGQRLLLWCEQGIGDQIMFLSLVPHLLRQGARLALVIEDRMLPLVRRSFPQVDVIAERIIVADPQLPVTMDAWTFLGDLPRHLSLFCGGTAAPEAWLRPDRRRADALRRALRARHPGRQLVGITWRSISPSSGPQRSIDPALWRPVLSVPQCAFVGLQYGAMPEDYEEFRRATGVQPDGGHGVEPMTDLDGLAALVDAVDLVICPVNSTIHFAGALGRPGWNLLPLHPDWRWGVRGRRSPWYPGLSLYRQAGSPDWRPVMRRVADDLGQWAVSRDRR